MNDANPIPDRDTFLELVRVHEGRIGSVVSRFLDDPRDIEEAVQDTFLQAWRHRDQFRNEAAVYTWLYRIATNTALMRLRRRRVHAVGLDRLSGREQVVLAYDPTDDLPASMDTATEVRRALAALPDHHRTIVILRDIEGLSNAEAGDLLGLPVSTVKAQLHRARAALRRSLSP